MLAQTYTHDVCFSLLVYGVDRIISISNMKYSLLAFTSLFPGFLSIVNNLTIPSSYYGVGVRFSNESIISKKNEYEYGDTFELVEIPVESNTSDGMKKLTFSLCCRFLYEWSKGTIALVGVYDHAGFEVVLLNPLRNALIGDCGSIFVICNNLELTLALLKTANPKKVWRNQRVHMAQRENKSQNSGIEMQTHDSFWKDLYKDPNALAPSTSKFDQFGLQKSGYNFDPKSLKFSRDKQCYRQNGNLNRSASSFANDTPHLTKTSSTPYFLSEGVELGDRLNSVPSKCKYTCLRIYNIHFKST